MQKVMITEIHMNKKSDIKRKLEYDRVKEMITFQKSLILKLQARPKVIYKGNLIYKAMEKQYLEEITKIDFSKTSIKSIERFIKNLDKERFVFKIFETKGKENFTRNFNFLNNFKEVIFEYSNFLDNGDGFSIYFYKPTIEQYYYYFNLL